MLTKIVQGDMKSEDEDRYMDQSDISLSAETIGDSQHNEDMDLNNVLDKEKFRFFVQYCAKKDELALPTVHIGSYVCSNCMHCVGPE